MLWRGKKKKRLKNQTKHNLSGWCDGMTRKLSVVLLNAQVNEQQQKSRKKRNTRERERKRVKLTLYHFIMDIKFHFSSFYFAVSKKLKCSFEVIEKKISGISIFFSLLHAKLAIWSFWMLEAEENQKKKKKLMEIIRVKCYEFLRTSSYFKWKIQPAWPVLRQNMFVKFSSSTSKIMWMLDILYFAYLALYECYLLLSIKIYSRNVYGL